MEAIKTFVQNNKILVMTLGALALLWFFKKK